MKAEVAFERIVDGMLAFRAEVGIEGPPDRAALAAVWSWTRRVAADAGELEQAVLANVLDGHMWVDWQGGEVVFRLSPKGIAYVEGLAGGSSREAIEALMHEMGLTVPETAPTPRPES